MSKPDGRLFEIAARAIGAAAGDIVMVGDSIRNDVEGAQNAGWKGIWLNRDGQQLPRDARPDAVITSLAELREVYVKLRATM